jgi:hypothetical protein
MTLARWFVLVASLGLFLPGCSSKPKGADVPPDLTLLQEVNSLLHAAAGAAGRQPTKVDDLNRYKSTYPQGYEAVKSGNVVVLWSTPQKGEGDVGKDETVLAYEKNVPTEGGYVLLSAGTVKKMTAAEFNAAPKPGKK